MHNGNNFQTKRCALPIHTENLVNNHFNTP